MKRHKYKLIHKGVTFFVILIVRTHTVHKYKDFMCMLFCFLIDKRERNADEL